MEKAQVVEVFKIFCFGDDSGLGSWLSNGAHDLVVSTLQSLSNGVPLTKVQFNQLLVVSQVASISDGFFHYYWRSTPDHPYDVKTVDGFAAEWTQGKDEVICSIGHFHWGMYRLYVDGLLFFGNVRAAFTSLRSLALEEINDFYRAKRFDTEAIAARGPALPLIPIARDDRHLISEMACKTFGELPKDQDAAFKILEEAWDRHDKDGGGPIIFQDLLRKYLMNASNTEQLSLAYDEVANEKIGSKIEMKKQFDRVAREFLDARMKAIQNTEYYLSMVNDLDVYVATSMRNRDNFRDMAAACEKIFSDERLTELHLRYFDPTLSAARGHEDKGLIECLMVKCAKVLVYCEGDKESYGKDAEAAMALSLGKPVVFYCDKGKKTNFYRDVHPLARLIDFRSGVAVGAIVTDDVDQVSELLVRLFSNRMQYRLEHHESRHGFLKLVDELTDSVVRLQTNDELITKTFWNNYHNRSRQGFISLAAGKEAERLQE